MVQREKNYKNSLSLLLMIIITCFTQVLTLMKSSMVAGYFGTSTEMDAYSFANSIVSFIFGFVASGISTIVIPCYVNKKSENHVDSFITALYGLIAIIVVIVLLLRYQIIGMFSNREELFVNIACNVLLVLLLSNYLSAISNITAAYYQCIGKYNIPKIIALISQFIVIVALLFAKNIDIIQYTYILSFGVIINFGIDLIVAIKNGWRYKLSFNFSDKETIRLIKLFLPIVFSTGIYKLSLMIDSTLASRLDEGKLTVLSYSTQIASMVNSIIIGNLLIYCYPKIVARIKSAGNQKLFWEQTSFFHLVVCLIISGFITVGKEGIAILFEHGQFDSMATMAVFIGALIYICGQQINVVRDLIYRYFYANSDTKTAASNSVLVGIINIIVSIILVKIIGFYGIIIGTVVASFVSLLRIMKQFDRKIGLEVSRLKLLQMFGRNVLITILTVLICGITKILLPSLENIIGVLVFGIETVIVFIVLGYFINKETILTIKKL